MPRSRRRALVRIIVSAVLFICAEIAQRGPWLSGMAAVYVPVVLFLAAYLVVGARVLLAAARNIVHGSVFDENFLMGVATVGAICLQQYPEAVAVMLFYSVGEFFESLAVDRSRSSIAAMMDIRPDFANVMRDGELVQVDPDEVSVGDLIVIRVGERVPLDGVVTSGDSTLDTSALTGESVPRGIHAGDEIISGAVNLSGTLEVQVSRVFGESTVSRILELVENASEKKARTENFVTRFARVYTPIVCGCALVLAIIPPLLFSGDWSTWIYRGLVFLVVSCPCALVISVPLSFFGGIGGASRKGILVKGSGYLEALSKTTTVVFDKTGTLTRGVFTVVAVHPDRISEDMLLAYAAHAEAYSNHPIAQSIRAAYGTDVDFLRIEEAAEEAGHGVSALVDGHRVLVGNDRLMGGANVVCHACELPGTILHVAVDGVYAGHIVISDVVKDDAAQAISALHSVGVRRTVMLTGDHEEVAAQVASELGLDEYHAELLPADKVEVLEELLDGEGEQERLAFVGDGINDAPVLMRADIGIAMGALGSDAAIEAADVVLMDDRPSKIALAVRIARKTLRIVYENIWFALGVKFAVLILAAFGLAGMWAAVFADVGVALIATMNATRAMRISE